MNNEPANGGARADASEGAADVPSKGSGAVTSQIARVSEDRPDPAVVASLVALGATVADTAVRILANLPFDPVVATPAVRRSTSVAAPLFVIGALAALAVTVRSPAVRVGLLFVAAFGALGVIASAAMLPAVLAVTLGGALALAGAFATGSASTGPARRAGLGLVAAGFALAVALSLFGAVGVVDGGLRGPGEFLALASLAAVGSRSRGDPVAAGTGLATVAVVVAAVALRPFVVGSAALVGLGVASAPHLLVAVALGGGVAAVVAGLRRGAWRLAAGAGLLLAAGMPVTLPRATAVLLGATLVVCGVTDEPTADAGRTGGVERTDGVELRDGAGRTDGVELRDGAGRTDGVERAVRG